MPTPVVIDLSHHNTIPEGLEAAARSGIVGVIHKATEGDTFWDKKYEARKYLASEAGLLFGAYHFLRPGDMDEQAAFFVEMAGLREGMVYAADHEDDEVSLEDLKQFMERVDDLIGVPMGCLVYSGHLLKEQLGGKIDPEFTGRRLWLAQYSSVPVLPPGFTSYWLWQYSDKGEVPGVDPPTNVNAIDQPLDSFIAQWQRPDKYTTTITISSNSPISVTVQKGERQ